MYPDFLRGTTKQVPKNHSVTGALKTYQGTPRKGMFQFEKGKAWGLLSFSYGGLDGFDCYGFFLRVLSVDSFWLF